MGLFDRRRKMKAHKEKAEWKMGLIPTIVEFEDEYMKLITTATEYIIFYKDIMDLEVVGNIVNIRTNVKRFSLASWNRREGADKARLLQSQILENMGKSKTL